MLKYLISKWPFALLGTILLGAIGSGVWDLVFKPSFSWLAEALLNIATLGLTTIRDQMYAEIAKGTYERAAVYIFAMLTGAVAAVFTALITALFFRNQTSDHSFGLGHLEQGAMAEDHSCSDAF
jgi:hypothetical protein